MNTSMKLSKADVLFHVRSFPETSWQIYNDVEVARGEADHDEIEKRLKELVEEGHIQSAKQKLRYVGVRTVYWR